MQGNVERLYVLHGGYAVQPNRAVYTPGRWAGEQIVLPCNAYLLRRRGEWILWDTGSEDALAFEPGGRIIAHGLRGIVVRTMAEQLAEIGIGPADIARVILSHGHFDHIGNANLFPHALWHMQRLEHEGMFGREPGEHGYVPALYSGLQGSQFDLLDGDRDLFGDGSVRVIFTPGHTPGHSSLLVRLAETGPVLLAADVAHYAYNLEHRCVPAFNADAELSRASMDRIEEVARQEGARIWLNHDAIHSARNPRAPAYLG